MVFPAKIVDTPDESDFLTVKPEFIRNHQNQIAALNNL